MAKVDLDLVKRILARNEIDTLKINSILEEINEEILSQDEVIKEPPVKKQFVFVLSDPKGEIPKKDFTGWVFQIPEDESIFSVKEKLISSAVDFNLTPKGRRMPVETIAEVCEYASAKILKERKLWVKTKQPCFVYPMPNALGLVKENQKDDF